MPMLVRARVMAQKTSDCYKNRSVGRQETEVSLGWHITYDVREKHKLLGSYT